MYKMKFKLQKIYINIRKYDNLRNKPQRQRIKAMVNTILTTTKWIIWKERNVAKYQKKKITKLKIINLIKNEISFIFSLAESKTVL